jgi:AraC-like DNA-binding protein
MNISVDNLHLYILNVGQAIHHGDWNWKNVRSPFARVFFVEEGSARVVMPSGTYNLEPNHLYYIPPFTAHSYICDKTFTHYYIHVYENPVNEQSILEEWELPFEVEGNEMDRELIRRLCQMNPFLKLPQSDPAVYDNHSTLINNLQMNQRRPFCNKIESRGILYIILSHFLKTAKPKIEVKDDRIHQVFSFIRKNLGSHIDVDMLADKTYMSKDHFIRVFKKETGITPNAFITKRKLERSELMLVTTSEPVKSIAASLGYEDCAYFNRLFKKHTGITPQQYRGKYSI